jgi:hypothetical protein
MIGTLLLHEIKV